MTTRNRRTRKPKLIDDLIAVALAVGTVAIICLSARFCWLLATRVTP